MGLRCHGAQSALHREEPTQDQRRWVNMPKVSHCPLLWLPLERSHTDTHCLSLPSEVRVAQLNPEIRSVINASDSHLLFYYWENGHLNLLSEPTAGARRNIFFSHVRKPGVIEHPHSNCHIINCHEIQTAHELFVKSWLLENKPRAAESKIHNRVFLVWVCWTEHTYDCITEMIHWKEECTVSQQRETREETNICWALLGPGSVCKWQSEDLNRDATKF